MRTLISSKDLQFQQSRNGSQIQENISYTLSPRLAAFLSSHSNIVLSDKYIKCLKKEINRSNNLIYSTNIDDEIIGHYNTRTKIVNMNTLEDLKRISDIVKRGRYPKKFVKRFNEFRREIIGL